MLTKRENKPSQTDDIALQEKELFALLSIGIFLSDSFHPVLVTSSCETLLCGFWGVCASGHSNFHLNLDLATAWFTETGMDDFQRHPDKRIISHQKRFSSKYFLNTRVIFFINRLTEENQII